MFPASRSCFANTTSATLTQAVATAAVLQTTSTVTRCRDPTTRPSPSRRSLQWPFVMGSSERSALRGDPHDEQRGDQEGHRVHPVRDVLPARGEEEAGDRRPDRPRHVLDRREQRRRLLSVVVRDEVREAGPDRGTEEAGGDAVDGGERDDDGCVVDERQGRERRRADEVRGDHQPPSRQPVDERAEGQPDHHDGKEVGDQERSEPAPRAGEVVDVDRQRERREVRADRRSGGRPEEQRETPVAAEEGQTACRSVGHARTLPPAADAQQWPKPPGSAATGALRPCVARGSARRALRPQACTARSPRAPASALEPARGRQRHRARARLPRSRDRRRRRSA